MQVHISDMSGKLDGFKAINTNTLSNKFCQKVSQASDDSIICTKCYSVTMLESFRKNCVEPFQRNSDLLSKYELTAEQIPIFKDAFVRFSGHGELINYLHLHNLVLIAGSNPRTRFGLWTKRKELVYNYFNENSFHRLNNTKPLNLVIIYSNPRIGTILDKPPNQYFDKTFNNVAENEFVEQQNCTGQQCKNCLLCYRDNNVTTIIEKVKFYGKKK
tara:strand:+ start:201 stop:848 length:648 start_codon:yes stop_codon:yes gene_type:complete